jgi:hypothetical protein
MTVVARKERHHGSEVSSGAVSTDCDPARIHTDFSSVGKAGEIPFDWSLPDG